MKTIAIAKEAIKNFIKMFPPVSYYRSKSFSQVWEDRLIAQYLNESKGTYVDIGAGMPIWGSNTYYFYKKKWSGVTVDPIQSNFRMQKIIRPRDKQYQKIISSNKTGITFYQLSPWELSTTDLNLMQERIARGAKLIRTKESFSISLELIYLENPIIRPSLLSIDVEGAEMDVLQSNNWNKYIPDIICIEEINNPLQNSEIRTYLLDKDFELVAYNGLSSIYIWKQTKFRKR
jgi:FkbM family methyltransferase